MARKIILDVDTGSDDAVAIMAAMLHPDLDLVAVCSVAGNSPIDNTTDNTLRVIDAMGGGVPVYRGATVPLAKFLTPWRGEDILSSGSEGLLDDGSAIKAHPDTLDFPAAISREMDVPAASFYVDYLRKSTAPVTLVLVGPLTNMALALIMDPSIAAQVDEIIIMGGGHELANQSVSAEFNMWYDPEAAQHVAHCGAKVTFVPLDATMASMFTPEDVATLRQYKKYACEKAADLIDQRITAINAMLPHSPPNCTTLHDALALLAAVDMDVLRDVKKVHLDIGLGDYGEGATIINRSAWMFNKPEDLNAYFAYGSNLPKYRQLLFSTLALSADI